jgi:sigma-54-interacting transcriptional regulator
MDLLEWSRDPQPGSRRPQLEALSQAHVLDIQLAAASTTPVLITGPRSPALKLVRTIVAADRRCDGARRVVCDAASADALPVFEQALSARAAVLVVCEVHALSEAAQSVLKDLAMIRPGRGSYGIRRIFTTSSISLFDCARQGKFDYPLFYMLNSIHIVIPAAFAGI